MEELENTFIDRYLLQQRLAKGGMSEIYLAREFHTNRPVAIKLVHSSDSNYCERFQREVKVIAALRHEHILPAFAYGTHSSWCYLVTPYIAGGTLSDRLASAPLSLQETGMILGQLGSALQFAHDHGIIHRDIKPSNVLLDNGEYVYLADFGLARRIEEESSLTDAGYLMGTPDYMAPELADQDASISSDIYALGVLLYQMLTGQLPFKGQTPVAAFMKHLYEKPLPPSLLNPSIPPAIERVVLRALEKNPRKRYQAVRDLVAAYQQAVMLEKTRPLDLSSMPAITGFRHTITGTTISTLLIRSRARKAARAPLAIVAVSTLLLSVPLLSGFSFYNSAPASGVTNLSSINTASMPLITSKMFGSINLKTNEIQKKRVPRKSATPQYLHGSSSSSPAFDVHHEHKHHDDDDD